MSLIHICSLMKANPFDYLIALQKYASETTMEETIHSSNYFLQGTGEACLVERINGDLHFNARAYFGDTNGKPPSAMMVVAILSRR